VSLRDERRAREIIAQYDDKDFTLTDATSFAVMERLGITYAFTFDHHFTQYGFIALTAAQA
jgi:predicted nucleic acid-binding protein